MELKYNPSTKNDSASFYVERKKKPYFGVHWHYHEEYELLYTIKGQGVRIVGDSMDHFNGNDLVFLGSGLPHLFKNEEKNENVEVDYIVLKFSNHFNGVPIFTLPEFQNIAAFLKNSYRGMVFSNATIERIKPYIKALADAQEEDKMIGLIQVLKIFATENNFQHLSSENFSLKISSKGEDRTQKVIDYISENYTKDITLDDLAAVAYMTTNSFCRYFKNRTGKTAFQFIREFRVNKACQMLINGEKSIGEICFDTGFNSFSSFNRIFKNLKNISASEYKTKYMQLNS